MALMVALAAAALDNGVAAASRVSAGPADWTPLVQVAQLQSWLHSPEAAPRVIDLRDPQAFAAGHIPGALNAPYARWRGPADNPGALLPLGAYVDLARSLGLHRDGAVVLVSGGGDPGDFGVPARVYWTLKWLGLSRVAILNGGMTAWSGAGQAVSRQIASATRSGFQPQLDRSVLITRSELQRMVHAPRRRRQLLDARPEAYYLGQAKAQAAARPGTIPGALDFDSARWFAQGDGTLPGAQTLDTIADQLPPEVLRAPGVVSFCNTGHFAATNWFVLSELLHRPNVRLYPGSMVDWSRAGEPMQNVPTRVEQLWAQLKQTWRSW